MKLSLRCTDNEISSGSCHLTADMVDFGPCMRPSHPKLLVERNEIEGHTIPPEILHVQLSDGDNVAHFHIRLGVKRGKPFIGVSSTGKDAHDDRSKKLEGKWCQKVKP